MCHADYTTSLRIREKLVIKFAIIGALWRRWFGGGFGKLGDITRLFKYIALFLIMYAMFMSVYPEYNFLQDTATHDDYIAFAVHWAMGHGDYFYLLDFSPDEPRIKWIDWTLRKIYGEGNYYNFKGNCTGLFLRYTSTAVLVSICIGNAWFIPAGLLTVLAYIVTCKLPHPIVWAELLSGALNFGLLYICLGG